MFIDDRAERRSNMPRPKKKPEYDPERLMNELLATVVEIYKTTESLKITASELNMSPLKVRKLLITAGVYTSDIASAVLETYNSTHSIAKTARRLSLSPASVSGYLPYQKMMYGASELSVAAERTALYRKRKLAVEALADGGMEELWACIEIFSGYTFKTVTGLKYTYTVNGGELFISRKEKSVTRASVEKAYNNVVNNRIVDGNMLRVYNRPKDLGDIFGISYIYPLFYRFGLIDVPEKVKVKMK